MRLRIVILAVTIMMLPPGLRAESGSGVSGLKAATEKLYVNHKQLEVLYREVREVAQGFANGPDRQLDYIQKIALYINEAKLIGYYQWALFSIHDYIEPAHLRDYYQLRLKDLLQAKDDLDFDLKLLDLYMQFIDDKAALKPARLAKGHIQADLYIVENLIAQLQTLTQDP